MADAGEAGMTERFPGLSVGADRRVVLEVVLDEAARGRRTVLALSWHRDDCLAVTIDLAAQPDHPALPRGQWVVLRDYLRRALERPTGDGSVRMRPDDAGTWLWLELERYGRPVCVSVSVPSVVAFLALTDRQIPHGAECADDAVDALLGRILER